MGTHANEALALLDDPSEQERHLLGAWTYQPNEVVLHTSPEVMPQTKAAWASWNFCREEEDQDERPVSVSYHMNRLQKLPASQPFFVSLNRIHELPASCVINRAVMYHPQYTFEALYSQPRLPSLNGQRNTWFCGSYFGYGFHEDAVRSAVEVAKGFGIAL